jgi:hypothetical protein
LDIGHWSFRLPRYPKPLLENWLFFADYSMMRKKSKTGAYKAIARLHGILKPKTGGKPLTEEWAEHLLEEKNLELRESGIN